MPSARSSRSLARLLAVVALAPLLSAATAAAPPAGEVFVVKLHSILHPVAAEFIADSLARADAARAAAVVLELDTPGGLSTSMRESFTAMLAAKTPVVVYVAPSGAEAASAGFFLLMASDVAAMAPGTNTGAAHPVGGRGETIEGVMGKKIEQDFAATIRSLAARNGRNAALAETAVVDSRSFTADEALAAHLIDLVEPSLPRLLAAIDGRLVKKGEASIVLHTAAAAVEDVEMSPLRRLLATVVDPNVAYLLLTLGSLGLFFELMHPGRCSPASSAASAWCSASMPSPCCRSTTRGWRSSPSPWSSSSSRSRPPATVSSASPASSPW